MPGGRRGRWFRRRVAMQDSWSNWACPATDLDTRYLDGLEYANLEVRRRAIAVASFDVVHGRMVLMHMIEREHAVQSQSGSVSQSI